MIKLIVGLLLGLTDLWLGSWVVSVYGTKDVFPGFPTVLSMLLFAGIAIALCIDGMWELQHE